MSTLIEESKKKFTQELNKGKILNVNEILASLEAEGQLKDLITSWYHNITKLNFLPAFPEDLEEISIHGPTYIVFRTSSKQVVHDSDLLREDLNVLLDYLTITNRVEWNTSSPFCSFFSTIRGRKVRITLIHGATSEEAQHKIFIRFLNEKVIPLEAYSKNYAFFSELVSSHKNILISGATGSGKTTFLNSLLSLVPSKDHIAILEDTKELISPHQNTTHFLADPLNEQYSLLSYLKYAMRITPKRIILGELRSSEVEPLLLALNSGHNGIMSSIHANDAKGALEKFALLCQMYGSNDLDYNLVLKLICNNIDYVIHLEDKKIHQVIQVYGSDNGQLFYEDLVPL